MYVDGGSRQHYSESKPQPRRSVHTAFHTLPKEMPHHKYSNSASNLVSSSAAKTSMRRFLFWLQIDASSALYVIGKFAAKVKADFVAQLQSTFVICSYFLVVFLQVCSQVAAKFVAN